MDSTGKESGHCTDAQEESTVTGTCPHAGKAVSDLLEKVRLV
jgi:hypothetical protein